MLKILKNKTNLIILLEYRKKAINVIQKAIMNKVIDHFSRDFNILNLLKSINNEKSFVECLILDLEKE